MKKNLGLILMTMLIANLLVSAAGPALAISDVEKDINEQLQPIADVYDSSSDIDEETFAETLAKIIKIVLGLLGIIFLILIIYAGFVWMTSSGNEEKVGRAKGIMMAAIIGVTIIIAAYIITIFVIQNLLEATGVSD